MSFDRTTKKKKEDQSLEACDKGDPSQSDDGDDGDSGVIIDERGLGYFLTGTSPYQDPNNREAVLQALEKGDFKVLVADEIEGVKVIWVEIAGRRVALDETSRYYAEVERGDLMTSSKAFAAKQTLQSSNSAQDQSSANVNLDEDLDSSQSSTVKKP